MRHIGIARVLFVNVFYFSHSISPLMCRLLAHGGDNNDDDDDYDDNDQTIYRNVWPRATQQQQQQLYIVYEMAHLKTYVLLSVFLLFDPFHIYIWTLCSVLFYSHVVCTIPNGFPPYISPILRLYSKISRKT